MEQVYSRSSDVAFMPQLTEEIDGAGRWALDKKEGKREGRIVCRREGEKIRKEGWQQRRTGDNRRRWRRSEGGMEYAANAENAESAMNVQQE
jgi:hypothetical protein